MFVWIGGISHLFALSLINGEIICKIAFNGIERCPPTSTKDGGAVFWGGENCFLAL